MTTELTTHILTDPAPWRAIAGEWQQLFDRSPTASTPLRFEWLWNWWQVYGPAYADQLRVVTFRRDGRLVGALPLYLARCHGIAAVHRLRFLSSGEASAEETCADYLDLLHEPDERDACLVEFVRLLAPGGELSDWDELDLTALSAGSPLASLLPAIAASDRHAAITPDEPCPIADLSGGFDAYLARLSSNGRQQARRLIRAAEKAGATMTLATPADAPAFLQDLIDLHQRRWQADGKPGCFASQRFTDLHRSLVQHGLPAGHVLLARLALPDGQPQAVLYGFRVGTKFDFYQSGIIDLNAPNSLQSPGITAHLLLMRLLAGQGTTTYDFLRGDSEYKRRLRTTQAPLQHLLVVKRNIRTRMRSLSLGAGRVARVALRRTMTTGARARRAAAILYAFSMDW